MIPQKPSGHKNFHQVALEQAINEVLEIFKEYIVSYTQSTRTPLPIKNSDGKKPNINLICDVFELSQFERYILVMAAAREVKAEFRSFCASANQSSDRPYPTLNLAVSMLPSSDWRIHLPDSPLFRWELIHLVNFEAANRAFQPFEIDPRIMAYLLGNNVIDKELQILAKPLSPSTRSSLMSYQDRAKNIASISKKTFQTRVIPRIQLWGNSPTILKDIAYYVSQDLEADIYQVQLFQLPRELKSIDRLIFLWERESRLRKIFLLIDCYEMFGEDKEAQKTRARIFQNLESPIILITREKTSNSNFLTFDIPELTPEQQRSIWLTHLSSKFPLVEKKIDEIISYFKLTPIEIEVAAAKARTINNNQSAHLLRDLWNVCQIESRPQLDELAKRIEAKAKWSELILPEQKKELLRQMVGQVRQRTYVYSQTNFANKSQRGRGINAIFWGVSGTGKTMGAEVIARELNLDLYRVDLSNISSKYIGETEKNLARLFDAAAKSGVILLFDEGESLFGKRAEIKDSRDKYANQEVNYLLQRLEEYSGLVIITTNIVDAIDTAFLRRFQFIINFPFPNRSQREKIWHSILPIETVAITEEDYKKLSRLNVAGGTIRNIALRATFMAADDNRSLITMKHLLEAAKSEYAKTNSRPTTAEIFDWILEN